MPASPLGTAGYERFRASLVMARIGRPFAGLFDAIKPLKPLAAMLKLAPGAVPAKSQVNAPGVRPAR